METGIVPVLTGLPMRQCPRAADAIGRDCVITHICHIGKFPNDPTETVTMEIGIVPVLTGLPMAVNAPVLPML